MSKMAELALEIEDMYFDEHLNIPEIAKRTGLSADDIAAYIDEMREYDKYDESMEILILPWLLLVLELMKITVVRLRICYNGKRDNF